MIEYRNINSNESGLSIRAKLNRMFSDLISGVEGVNRLWKRLVEVDGAVKSNATEVSNLRDELQNRLFDVLGYTDREINDLLSYINGMYGGVNGFAEDTNFQPTYPEDVAATVIGIGPGTFSNMLDENGTPITVDSESVVIFFKAEGSTYWKYKTVIPTVVRNEVAEEFGGSSTKVISQKFFTEQMSGTVGGAIDITDVAVLDGYGDATKNGLYALKKGGAFAGNLLVSGDIDATLIYQFIFGGYSVEDGNLISGERGGIVYRIKNVASLTSEINRGSWSNWKFIQDEFMQAITEEQYAALKESGQLVASRFYFIIEEEQQV